MLNKTITLIISGGVAAYKSHELIRLLRKANICVLPVLTEGGAQFVTPLSISALAQHPVYTDLWSLKDESEMGHIRLSRDSDLIVASPASADLIAKMAHGLAGDLASTLLLASDKPILIAPAMNQQMWNNPATQRNIQTLKSDGIMVIEPASGAMACGETGEGRLPEAQEIFTIITNYLFHAKPLAGKTAIVTSGPTYEPIDPVRFIGNRSSGKQGHAIAAQLAKAGASVTLITGSVNIPPPYGVSVKMVETAQDMKDAVLNSLPADIAVCAAAVADWRVENPAPHKIKKRIGEAPPQITLAANPDILFEISHHKNRPQLVIGFALESENMLENARAKRDKKGCDWILANHMGIGENPVFGADHNQVTLVTNSTTENWPNATKADIACTLVARIALEFEQGQKNHDAIAPAPKRQHQ